MSTSTIMLSSTPLRFRSNIASYTASGKSLRDGLILAKPDKSPLRRKGDDDEQKNSVKDRVIFKALNTGKCAVQKNTENPSYSPSDRKQTSIRTINPILTSSCDESSESTRTPKSSGNSGSTSANVKSFEKTTPNLRTITRIKLVNKANYNESSSHVKHGISSIVSPTDKESQPVSNTPERPTCRPRADPTSPGTYLPPAHTAARLRNATSPQNPVTKPIRKTKKEVPVTPASSKCRCSRISTKIGDGKRSGAACNCSSVSNTRMKAGPELLTSIIGRKAPSISPNTDVRVERKVLGSSKKKNSQAPSSGFTAGGRQGSSGSPHTLYPALKSTPGTPSLVSKVVKRSATKSSSGSNTKVLGGTSPNTKAVLEVSTAKVSLRPLLLPLLVGQREGSTVPSTPPRSNKIYICSSTSSPSLMNPRFSKSTRIGSAKEVPKALKADAPITAEQKSVFLPSGSSDNDIKSHASSTTLLSKGDNESRRSGITGINETRRDENKENEGDAKSVSNSSLKDFHVVNNPIVNMMIPHEFDIMKSCVSVNTIAESIMAFSAAMAFLCSTLPRTVKTTKSDASVMADLTPLVEKVDCCIQTETPGAEITQTSPFENEKKTTSTLVDTSDFEEYLKSIQKTANESNSMDSDKPKPTSAKTVDDRRYNENCAVPTHAQIIKSALVTSGDLKASLRKVPSTANTTVLQPKSTNIYISSSKTINPKSVTTPSPMIITRKKDENAHISSHISSASTLTPIQAPSRRNVRIPTHLDNKKNANAEIQLELDFLRTRTNVARGVNVLDKIDVSRKGIFGGAKDLDELMRMRKARRESEESGCNTTSRDLGNSDGDAATSGARLCPDGEPLSLRAMAILHRIKQNAEDSAAGSVGKS